MGKHSGPNSRDHPEAPATTFMTAVKKTLKKGKSWIKKANS
jgi:hypothetical protein